MMTVVGTNRRSTLQRLMSETSVNGTGRNEKIVHFKSSNGEWCAIR